ncbi:MAG: hypothetical protein WB586_10830 [Chthoniobacterales bacterium]
MALDIEGRSLQGEFLRSARTVNTMVDQLSSFASEVTRVAREVGTEGKLGGQADVRGVAGTWKDLTDSVNFMARNLTNQVRNIAAVTTAVATGDLSKKIAVDITRFGQAKFTLTIGTAHAHELLRSILDICSNEISAKNLLLNVELEATEYGLQADVARLRQVFWNLVKNARGGVKNGEGRSHLVFDFFSK